MTPTKKKTIGTRLSTNRHLLRAIYFPWILLPYPVRRVVTIGGVWALQTLRRARRVHRQSSPTAPEKMFTLSFWGVPNIDQDEYVLRVGGSVSSPFDLSLEELKGSPAVEREVTLDCVGGSRINCAMQGVLFEHLMKRAEPEPGTRTAIFHCADGYFTTHPVEDLINTDAFLAYTVNRLEASEHGHPLRLVAPGKYGYKWAKWVVMIQFTTGSPKGYWERRGLPDNAWVGDTR